MSKKFDAKLVSGDGTLTVVISGSPYTISTGHLNYVALLKAVKKNDAQEFLDNLNTQQSLQNFTQGKAKLVDGKVYYNGKQIHNALSNKIVSLMRDGFEFAPMLRFLENLMDNPSSNSVDQLYKFLEHKNMPITEDGCFIAYKTVRSDFYSKAAGSLNLLQGKANSNGNIYNGLGETIECNRNEVDDRPGHHCSKGLHVGALSYAGPGGWYNNCSDVVVIVKVNPKDAVAVPNDHNFTKLRVSKYKVVSLYKEPLADGVCSDECGSLQPLNIGKETLDELLESDISADDLLYGEAVSFDYNGKTHCGLVEENNWSTIKCRLLRNDPDFDERDYSNFTKSKMENITVLST